MGQPDREPWVEVGLHVLCVGLRVGGALGGLTPAFL